MERVEPLQSDLHRVRQATLVPRRVQPERDPRGEASGADHYLAALRAQHAARAGEVQDDLEEGEVRWHLRHLADGQEQDREAGHVGELIMCATQDEYTYTLHKDSIWFTTLGRHQIHWDEIDIWDLPVGSSKIPFVRFG